MGDIVLTSYQNEPAVMPYIPAMRGYLHCARGVANATAGAVTFAYVNTDANRSFEIGLSVSSAADSVCLCTPWSGFAFGFAYARRDSFAPQEKSFSCETSLPRAMNLLSKRKTYSALSHPILLNFFVRQVIVSTWWPLGWVA